jgi:pimeloyl-ACP methyl ester carboxylesterase
VSSAWPMRPSGSVMHMASHAPSTRGTDSIAAAGSAYYIAGNEVLISRRNEHTAHRYGRTSQASVVGTGPLSHRRHRRGCGDARSSAMRAPYRSVQGEGRPIVLLHAGALDSRMFDKDIAALARLGRVLRYDRSGSGRSPSAGVPVDRVRELHDLATGAFADRPALLVGSSFGGLVAIDYALTYPTLVAGLLLVGPDVTGATPSDELRERIGALTAAAHQGAAALASAWLADPHHAPGGLPAETQLASSGCSLTTATCSSAAPRAPRARQPSSGSTNSRSRDSCSSAIVTTLIIRRWRSRLPRRRGGSSFAACPAPVTIPHSSVMAGYPARCATSSPAWIDNRASGRTKSSPASPRGGTCTSTVLVRRFGALCRRRAGSRSWR